MKRLIICLMVVIAGCKAEYHLPAKNTYQLDTIQPAKHIYYVSKISKRYNNTWGRLKGLRGWYLLNDDSREHSFISIVWVKK